MHDAFEHEPRRKGGVAKASRQTLSGSRDVGVEHDTSVMNRKQPAQDHFAAVAWFGNQAEMQ
jgi:hypothetical protein